MRPAWLNLNPHTRHPFLCWLPPVPQAWGMLERKAENYQLARELFKAAVKVRASLCVCVCMCVCERACVHVCMCVRMCVCVRDCVHRSVRLCNCLLYLHGE